MANIFSGIGTLQRALNYHLERHNVLASNVANVDTPGFQPMELLRDDIQSPLTGAAMQTTNMAHMPLGVGLDGTGRVIYDDNTVLAGADGNAVSLEREMSKIAVNDLRYDGIVKLVSKEFAMLRYAANDGG